ncbi:MAG: diguanylate cyclase/phosphodiesterase with sensor(s) [Frankiales bacterium]|nr:diguanylate cyclase/phosphodiesterase with sensor(s) [Frankiales bacterium]
MASLQHELPSPSDGGPSAQASQGLFETLQLVADTIVESLGFEVAVVNLVDTEGSPSMVVAAVAGPAEVRNALLGRRQGLDGWRKLLAASEPWGKLHFLDHATSPSDPADIFTWIPDLAISDSPDAWHPEDALFATLQTGSGRHLGMLSVDVPRDGLRPGPATRHALEAFAVTASLAIEHATMAQESERAARRFTAVFDSSPVAVAILGPDGLFERVNRAYCLFLQRDEAELIGRSPLDFTHPEDVALAEPASARARGLTAAPEASDTAPVEKRYVLRNGDVVWGRLHLAPLYGPHDARVVVAQIEDITERKRTEAQLVQQANFDALTSLPNRRQAMGHLQRVLDRGALGGHLTAVFFCDLDRLKLVNDGHGHAVGDAYIREVSSRIRSAVRAGDLVGRLSGDEFVAVIEGLAAPTEAIGLAGRVIEQVRQPLSLGGAVFLPSVSLGIAYSTGHTFTADELVAQADSAMYRAKQEDRGAWQVYDATLRGSAAAQLELRRDVSGALEAGQFVLHYQPIVRLHDEEITGYEALLRWQHPRRGLLLPGEFLDVILDSEYEAPVTDWLIQQACRDATARPAGSQRVSINVSSLMMGRRDLPDVITAALQASGLPPDELVLELTEDRLLSRADGPDLLAALRGLGVALAMDDFGTGYAGLANLQRFPSISILKLDQSFTASLGRDAYSTPIVTAVRDLARSCGLHLIIEGVETVEQADQLRSLGIEAAQGYYFGRPRPLAEDR